LTYLKYIEEQLLQHEVFEQRATASTPVNNFATEQRATARTAVNNNNFATLVR
jgi:hypothetical protein